MFGGFVGISYAEHTRFPDGLSVASQTQEASATKSVGSGNLFVAGSLEVAGGLVNVSEIFFDIPTASSITYIDGNNVIGTISTTTLVSNGTSFALANTDYSNTADPRNVVAVVSLDAGTSTTTVVGSLIISGVDARGNSTTETISISTTSAVGNKAWSSITSMTVSVTSISPTNSANAHISIGTGDKIGLSNDIASASDVIKVNEGGTATTGYTLSTTYNTITFVNAPNSSRDYRVIYKTIGR